MKFKSYIPAFLVVFQLFCIGVKTTICSSGVKTPVSSCQVMADPHHHDDIFLTAFLETDEDDDKDEDGDHHMLYSLLASKTNYSLYRVYPILSVDSTKFNAKSRSHSTCDFPILFRVFRI